MFKKRSITGLHKDQRDPCELQRLFNELKPIQVQMNHGKNIMRGELSEAPVLDSVGKIITVHLNWAYEGNYPKSRKDFISWQRMDCRPLQTILSIRRKRVGFEWVSDPEDLPIIQTHTTLSFPFNHFYLTREGRIKVIGTCDHFRFLGKAWRQRDDFWRFFGNNDQTNLIIDEDGKVSQKETII